MLIGFSVVEGFVSQLILKADNGLKLYTPNLVWLGAKEKAETMQKFFELAEQVGATNVADIKGKIERGDF